MAQKVISVRKIGSTITICLCPKNAERPEGYWLYDTTQGFNIAMAVATEDIALEKAFSYYQGKVEKLETEIQELQNSISSFIKAVRPSDIDDTEY